MPIIESGTELNRLVHEQVFGNKSEKGDAVPHYSTNTDVALSILPALADKHGLIPSLSGALVNTKEGQVMAYVMKVFNHKTKTVFKEQSVGLCELICTVAVFAVLGKSKPLIHRV